jgi:hypothetical protein
MPSLTVQAAEGYVRDYMAGSALDAAELGREPATIPPKLVRYQAERALELARKLGPRGAVLLDDPVGTGKTVVALSAAALLLDKRTIDRVLVVAPNDGVSRLWRTRAGFLGLDRSTGLEVHTRKLRRSRRSFDERKRTLVIVDEAHRLQNPGTLGYDRLAGHAADSRVLLVTATPFQLEARGLENMLRLPEHRAGGRPSKPVKVGPIRAYAGAVAGLLKAEHDLDLQTTEKRAKEQVDSCEADALEAMSPFFISMFDRSRVGVEDFTKRGIPDARPVVAPAGWAPFYQVLRVLPTLPRLHDFAAEAKSSDSYQRMLLSSHRALRHHKAFDDVREWASGKDAPRSASSLMNVVEERLSAVDERAHPKVQATAEWVSARLAAGRHVLVFCVWANSQSAIGAAIEKTAPRVFRVETPEHVVQARALCDQSFGHPVDAANPPMAMVVRDNLSESVDMDGGHPCVVHHDLVWNPVRWDQRMGRVIRASSGFLPIADRDIYLPVLDVAADRRLYETMCKRRDLTGHVLQMASLVGDPEVEEAAP